MGKERFSDADRATIVRLRDSGLTWEETSKKASKELGEPVTSNSCRFQYRKGKTGVDPNRSKRPAVAKKKGHTLDDFRNQFDVTKKIDDKVEEFLTDDGEEYWTDDEFRQLCGVSVQNWRRHAELDRYRKFQFKKPNFHAWASPKMVEAMQEITGHAGH